MARCSVSRLHKLRAHHDVCERHYEKVLTQSLIVERERTLFFHRALNTAKEDVPPLTRTDSVILTKEMLGCNTDVSLTSFSGSDSDYVPASSEDNSEDSLKPSNKNKDLLKGLELLIQKEKTKSSKNDSGKRTKKKGREKGNSSSSEEDLDEIRQRRKRRYKKRYKRDSSSQGEDEPDNSIKKRKNTKTYGKYKKSTDDAPSVEKSDGIIVAQVAEKDGIKKYHKKTNFCLYCGEAQKKIPRHLERKHADKTDVKSAMALPKNSKERRKHLDLLRKQGNRAHNIAVLSGGKGTLVACKQQSKSISNAKDYQHCFGCFGYFKRKSMWKHAKRCALAQSVRRTLPGKTRVQALCAAAQPVPKDVHMKVWSLVNAMTQDDIAHAVKDDGYIMKVGEKMYNRQCETASQHDNVRQIMRGLGRLLIAGRTVTPLKTMEDFINPQNFHHVTRAVKEVAGFDEKKNKFAKPTLATKLGQSMQRVADIMEAEALSSQNNVKKQTVAEFRRMYTLTWNEMVSSPAYRTLEEKKWNKPKLIPLADDVKKMHMYMSEKQKQYHLQLMTEKTSRNWSSLAKVVLAQIILFNRRREGEVSKMRLETFITRDNSLFNEDIGEALTALEKRLCQHFERVEIRGKRGRKVPIILTPAMVNSLELLVEERSSCGVDGNIYLFARPGFQTRLRGSDCIRELAKKCGAEKPECLSSTKLRKQVATLSRVLNLNDTEQDLLADFLGHDIRVHRKFYRLPEGTLQLAKISKVLMACEQGRLAEFKGRSLDQISISPNDQSEVIEESSGESSVDEGHPTSLAEEETVTRVERDTPEKQFEQKRGSEGGSSVNEDQQGEDEQHSRAEEPVTHHKKATSKPKSGQKPHSQSTKKGKRKWSPEEVRAVENSLREFIRVGKTPGKKDCMDCIAASPVALAQRDWKAVKFYVYNRIISDQRL